MIIRIIIFLIANFAALVIGGMFTGAGVSSDWYQQLNKAPWTPPGWVFGAAWTAIMICFAFYMNALWNVNENKAFILSLFVLQWILNVGWNPIFFHYQNIFIGAIVISALTVLIGFFTFYFWSTLKFQTIWLLPYFFWLLIATSLNGYILFKN